MITRMISGLMMIPGSWRVPLPASRQKGWLAALVLLALLLAGCGGELSQTITFFEDEGWSTEMTISFPATLVALGGTTELDAELNGVVSMIQAEGGRAEWRSEQQGDRLVYTVEASGEGYTFLQRVAQQTLGPLDVYADPGGEQIYFSMPVQRSLLDANSYTYAVRGGEIVETNGQLIRNDTVQWINPTGRMEAILTPCSQLSMSWLWWPAGILVVLAGIFTIIRLVRKRSRRCDLCGQPVMADALFCGNCGASVDF